MKRMGRDYGVAFKVQVAFAAFKGDKTLAELAEQVDVHPTRTLDWKQRVMARAIDVFGSTKPTLDTPDVKVLRAKIRQLALEHDC